MNLQTIPVICCLILLRTGQRKGHFTQYLKLAAQMKAKWELAFTEGAAVVGGSGK
jgi:hypothetical protein